jgi:RTX calcium-binding nonapeptide repeat (4 copies)
LNCPPGAPHHRKEPAIQTDAILHRSRWFRRRSPALRRFFPGAAAALLLVAVPSQASARPDTRIDSGPSGLTNERQPTFEFSSTVPGSTFECRIGGIGWFPCSSPKTFGLPRDTRYTFEVRAIDPAGSRDRTPASRSFALDTSGPDATITGGPIGVTDDQTPTFSFSSSESESTFVCNLNLIGRFPCGSPWTFNLFDSEFNTLEVFAVDRAGNGGFSVDRSFRIDPEFDPETNPPLTAIIGGTSYPATFDSTHTVSDPTPTFFFASSKSGSTFECALDDAPYSPCSSTLTTSHLDDGQHVLLVRSIDAAGRVGPPDREQFSVLTVTVEVSGSTLFVTAPPPVTLEPKAPGPARDNLKITRPSSSTLRVTDLPHGTYTGSGLHAGPGCTRSGDYTATCSAAGIRLIHVSSGGGADKVLNATGVESLLEGGRANDNLRGGANDDTVNGNQAVDVLRGKGGNDRLIARDTVPDWWIDCDGDGTSAPGNADVAVLDRLPNDPNYAVANCEEQRRP